MKPAHGKGSRVQGWVIQKGPLLRSPLSQVPCLALPSHSLWSNVSHSPPHPNQKHSTSLNQGTAPPSNRRQGCPALTHVNLRSCSRTAFVSRGSAMKMSIWVKITYNSRPIGQSHFFTSAINPFKDWQRSKQALGEVLGEHMIPLQGDSRLWSWADRTNWSRRFNRGAKLPCVAHWPFKPVCWEGACPNEIRTQAVKVTLLNPLAQAALWSLLTTNTISHSNWQSPGLVKSKFLFKKFLFIKISL